MEVPHMKFATQGVVKNLAGDASILAGERFIQF
jgi:hypothetical protein